MAGNSLTVSSQLQCPHGGTVNIISSNTRVKAQGSFMATMADTATVTGCPFQIPIGVGTIPSPCLYVQWLVPDTRARVNGTFTLSQGSVGVCIGATGAPQGTVIVSNTQSKVSTL